MPLNLKADDGIDIFLTEEEYPQDSVIDNDQLVSTSYSETNVNSIMQNCNIDSNESNLNVVPVSKIFDLDSTTFEDTTSSKNNEILKNIPLTIKEMEDDFDESSDKISLFDTLNSLKKDKGWEQKVQEFAEKSINDNTLTDNEEVFQDYVTHLTDFGVKSFPQAMTNEIKEKISNFVKNRLDPIAETYKEALIQAGEKIIQPMKEIKCQIDYNKPSPFKIVYVCHEKDTQDKMGQVKPNVFESSTSTIVGQGTYHEEDFNTILKHDVKMSFNGDPDYNSDEESGIMRRDEEVHLVSKLEREAERQIRIQNDFREALNPNIGLELNGMYSDHKHIMDTIVRIRSDDIEIYNDSIVANHDKTLPPPEVLTYKYKGRIYKLVTVFKWQYLDDNNVQPSEQRQKRVNKIQKFYLHLPPPAMLPMRKRLFNVMEIPISSSPPKISKSALNSAISGVKIGKNIPTRPEAGNKNGAQISDSEDLIHNSIIDKDDDGPGNNKSS
uniref:Uncharacterized protein n=1 Tax=Panagrolaimus sp. ES5 TaxID=591445 RepID=A0AC34FGR8_9BILA